MHVACFPQFFYEVIQILEQDIEQLTFDLHRWFRISHCKQEDFINPSEGTNIQDESLSLHHVSIRG